MNCNKVKYKTSKQIKYALAWCNVKYYSGNDSYKQIRYYWCKLCKAYHLTSKTKKQKINFIKE